MRSPIVEEYLACWRTITGTHCEKPFCHGTHVTRLQFENALVRVRELVGEIEPDEMTAGESALLFLDCYKLNWEITYNNAGNSDGEPERTFRPPWSRDRRLAPDECELCYDETCRLCHPSDKTSRADLRDEIREAVESCQESMPAGLPRFLRRFSETP